jgi:translocator protein
MLATRKDIAYSLVIIWALIGIGVNHNGNQTVVMLTEVASALVVVALVLTLLVTRFRKK